MSVARSRLVSMAAGCLWLVASLGAASCSKSVSVGSPKTPRDAAKRSVAVVHEPCDAAKAAQKTDANGDGKAEISTVMSGGRMECQAMDLNFDGSVDRYTYYDASGQLRRVESDYDRDGRTDEIALYQGGVLVERQREMNLDGRLDSWVFYENGAAVRQERDTDGDGRVDEWWQYTGSKGQDGTPCVIVSKDIDGDGIPEPSSQIDSCKPTDNYAPPIPPAPSGSAPMAAPTLTTTASAASSAPMAPTAPTGSAPVR